MLIGCAVFLFALYLSKANVTLRFILLRRSAALLADISNSPYLTHFPIVLVITVANDGTNQVKPDSTGISQFIGCLGAVLLTAVFLWWQFKRDADSIRHKVIAFIARRKGCMGGNK
jgi:peptidoglycan/LPS O-acetylase OafA/YrhL